MTTSSKRIFEGYEVEVLCNPRLKNSYIQVSTDNTISLKTPYKSKSYIDSLLYEKKSWIEKQLEKNRQHPKKVVNLEDEVLLFGEIYSIDSDEATLLREKLQRLKNPDQQKVLKAYDTFYKEFAKLYLTQEIKKYADIMNLNFSELKFRKMRRRWGSCSSKRVITLNSELMKLPKEQISYVVIHELAHLVHMNHSKAFHTLVESYLPNAKQIRKELKISRVLS